MFTLKHVTAVTSDRRHVPAVNIIRLTTEVALKTLVARPREEVMLSGPGLKKNKEQSHLGTEGLGTARGSIGPPAITPFCNCGLQTRDAAPGLAN